MFSKTAIAIRFNLLQVCPSVPAFVFIPYSNFLSGYFYVSLNLVAVSTVLILIKQYNNNTYSEAEAYMLLSEVMNI